MVWELGAHESGSNLPPDPGSLFQGAKMSARLVSYLTNEDPPQRRCSDLLVP
jgi:hypothetical protein